jgi:hypothetical protein
MTKKKLSDLSTEESERATILTEEGATALSIPAPPHPSTEVFFTRTDDGKINIDTERMKNFKVFFATPCYGGMLTDQYFLSLFQAAQVFMRYQIEFKITTLRNESLITRARNLLVSMFLEDPEMTHLMFIDADIEFPPDAIMRMLAMNKDVVCGAYPKKTVSWPSVGKAASEGHTDLDNYQAEYAINLKFIDPEKRQVNADNGSIEVLDASTGFMLIKRQVILDMIEHYPELKYNNDASIDPKYNPHCYALFDCMIDPVDRRYLSEDYTFCRRWQQMGGRIWIDPSTNLNHIGSYTFKGNIGKLFSAG